MPVVALTVIILVGISVAAGRAVYNHMFPVADPIRCPEMERIAAVTLIGENGASVVLEPADAGELLRRISDAQPTRLWSIQDYPEGKSYYTMEIDTDEREYRYFFYAEDSKVYVESPYEGVYQTDQQILELVAQRFKN